MEESIQMCLDVNKCWLDNSCDYRSQG